jgi:hypothetical protein
MSDNNNTLNFSKPCVDLFLSFGFRVDDWRVRLSKGVGCHYMTFVMNDFLQRESIFKISGKKSKKTHIQIKEEMGFEIRNEIVPSYCGAVLGLSDTVFQSLEFFDSKTFILEKIDVNTLALWPYNKSDWFGGESDEHLKPLVTVSAPDFERRCKLEKERDDRRKRKHEYKLYRQEVLKWSYISIRHFPIKGNYTNNSHLDHIVSVKDGFINKISPIIIGSHYNLRFISGSHNMSKGAKSDMTIGELLRLYSNFK